MEPFDMMENPEALMGAIDIDMMSATNTVEISPVVVILVGALYVIVLVLMFVSMWKIYTKANKPGWSSLIPIYNIVVWLEIVQRPIWWIFLMFIPFVNIIISVIVTHDLSRAFGREVGTTLGLLFFPMIFFPILAFGSATYISPNEPTSFQPENMGIS